MFNKKKSAAEKQSQRHELKKGDQIIALDENHALKIIHKFGDLQREWLDNSTLVFVGGRSNFMHYMRPDLAEKQGDPEWENQAVYFWDAGEAFPQKSLPPYFKQFPKHYFTFTKTDLGQIQLVSDRAAPWFRQPGGGTKYYCEKNNHKLTIEELHEAGLIGLFEFVDFALINREILCDREHDYFLAADSLGFIGGRPAYNGKVMPISTAYATGLCTLVRRV